MRLPFRISTGKPNIVTEVVRDLRSRYRENPDSALNYVSAASFRVTSSSSFSNHPNVRGYSLVKHTINSEVSAIRSSDDMEIMNFFFILSNQQ